jgi:O-antigen/teichoic acid export membrane protein
MNGENKNTVIAVVGKGLAWTTFGTIASKFVGFASTFLILKHMSISEYGLLELALATIAIFNFFFLPGVQQVVIVDISKAIANDDTSHARAITRSFFRIQMLLSITAFIVIIGLSYIPIVHVGDVSRQIMRILAFGFLLSPLRQTANTILAATYHFKHKVVAGIVEETAKCLLLILFFLVLKQHGPVSVAYSIILASLVQYPIIIPMYLRVVKKWNIARAHVNIFSYIKGQSFFAMLTSYATTFGQSARLWIIRVFLGPDAVGLFSLALGLYNHTQSLFNVSTAILPVLSRYKHEPKHLYRIAHKAIKYQLIFFVVTGLLAISFGPLLLKLLLPKYIPVLPLYFIMLLAVMSSAFAVVFTALFQAIGAQKDLFIATAVKTVLILALCPIAILVFGVYGPSVELVLTITLFSLLRYKVLAHDMPGFKIDVATFFSFDEDDKTILAIVKKKLSPLTNKFAFTRRLVGQPVLVDEVSD